MHDRIRRQFHNVRSKDRRGVIKTVGGNECWRGGGIDIEGLSAEYIIALRKIIEFHQPRRATKGTAHETAIGRRREIKETEADFQTAGFIRFDTADDVVQQQVKFDREIVVTSQSCAEWNIEKAIRFA